jgi:hypothetical protein
VNDDVDGWNGLESIVVMAIRSKFAKSKEEANLYSTILEYLLSLGGFP